MGKISLYRIAIVGGGACGISLLYHLSKKISSNTLLYKNIEIDLYEPDFNGGIAYSTEIETHILNMLLSSMSIEPDNTSHFIEFLRNTPKEAIEYNDYLDNFNDGNPPRALIKKYLDYVLNETLGVAKLHPSFKISLTHKRVLDIVKKERMYQVCTKEGPDNTYNSVVLAVGNLKPKNHRKDLIGAKRYVENPWPFDKLLTIVEVENSRDQISINKKQIVGVIGSSLTSIDIVLGLEEKGFKGEVHFFSRNGLLPTVQAPENIFNYRSKVRDLPSSKESYRLDEIVTIIKHDIEKVENRKINFQDEFEKRKKQSALKNIELDIAGVNEGGYKYQDYLFKVSKYLPSLWDKIEDEGKTEFLKSYMSLWSIYRSAMPLSNAKKIRSLLRQGKLVVHRLDSSEGNIVANEEGFEAKCFGGQVINCDYMVNATGTSLDTKDTEDVLVNELLSKGYIQHHLAGGLEVDVSTLEVIDDQGAKSERLHLLGALTRGNLFYTNAYEANIRQAKFLSKVVLRDFFNSK